MTDFDYENLQKKRIAQGASHRKGGSKSKKCTLPSDLLTEAQRRKLNGPVTSVHLNQPMDWATFKGLSDQLKKIYIQNLRDMYNANAKMLASMFGVRDTTVYSVMKSLGFAPGKRGGDNNSNGYQRKMAMWNAFCNGVVGGGDNNVPTKNESVEEGEDLAQEALEKGEEAPMETDEKCDAALDELNKSFEVPVGTVDPEDLIPDEEPEQPEIRAKLSKLQVSLSGDYRSVVNQIAELAEMFGGNIKVRLEILADEGGDPA